MNGEDGEIKHEVWIECWVYNTKNLRKHRSSIPSFYISHNKKEDALECARLLRRVTNLMDVNGALFIKILKTVLESCEEG